jgi:hypothetical protein
VGSRCAIAGMKGDAVDQMVAPHAGKQKRPRDSVERGVQAILRLIAENEISVLNVAGPGASGWLQGYEYGLHVIARVIASRDSR